MTGSADVVVLGAGPAGLAAATQTARSGRSVVVLERNRHVGGLAASIEVAGVRVDLGSHRLHPAIPSRVLADLRRLLGADLQTRPRNGRLRVAGRWVGFPLRAGELLRALPPSLTAGIALDALTAPLRRPRADTYVEVLRVGLGGRLSTALHAPYAEKLWGLPPERIDGEQARRRVTADTPWKIVARLLRGRDEQGRVFHYPRRGFGQIVEALAAAATDAGAEIRLGTEVTGVEGTGDRVGVQGIDGDGVDAGHVLSTVPLPLLARLAGGPVPDPPLRFRAMVLVYLVHEGPRRWTPYDAHYLPGPEIAVTRISEPANYRDSAADPTDRTVLCAEIPCDVGDATWSAPDEDLVRAVADGLARVGLPPVRLAGAHVRRLPHVYPVYEVGHAARLAALDAWARALPRVTTFGRLGLFAHDNTHHALAEAYDAVAALRADGARDEAAW
ncbi:MAG TPA: FAD-dependent oxidoreductase, partial [Mycobacteriales bacterium]|nr:FAD-dependent oxidoreductase [Mycobacteriales bacterium]